MQGDERVTDNRGHFVDIGGVRPVRIVDRREGDVPLLYIKSVIGHLANKE